MKEIEIIYLQSQRKEQVALDIFQLQMIHMYEELINQQNVLEYLLTIARQHGYMVGIQKTESGRFRFSACDSDVISRICMGTVNGQFETISFFVKKMLTQWHKRNNLLQVTDHVTIELTKQQRGVLQKILKMEKKRKRLEVR